MKPATGHHTGHHESQRATTTTTTRQGVRPHVRAAIDALHERHAAEPTAHAPSRLSVLVREVGDVREVRESTRPTTATNHSDNFYKGYNVHAYTKDIRRVLPRWLPIISEVVGNASSLDHREFARLLIDIQRRLGNKPALQNIRKAYNPRARPPGIRDPDLPGLDSALLLKAVWVLVQETNDASVYGHFAETLDQIGNTCMQGITHRLFGDFVALADF